MQPVDLLGGLLSGADLQLVHLLPAVHLLVGLVVEVRLPLRRLLPARLDLLLPLEPWMFILSVEVAGIGFEYPFVGIPPLPPV